MAVTGMENYTIAYSYDANNRLTQDVKTVGSAVITGNYFYDPNGNQLARVSETLTPAGSGTSQVGIDPSGVELYEYDGRNRQVYSNVNGEAVFYTYRADGLRNSKETAAGKTTHLWDGANIAADMNGSSLISHYVRGVGLILSDDGAAQKFYLFNDHGDVVQLASNAGVILWQYDFDSFGNEREIAGQDAALDTNPWRYCGEYFDKETGAIYLRARYYNPVTSRMLTEDSVRFNTIKMPNEQELVDPLSLNLYTYCFNNPIRYNDPSGNIVLVDDAAIMLILGTGLVISVTSAWLNSPEGQKAINDGAVAIQNGVVIAGQAVTSAAKAAVESVKAGASWVGGKVSDAWNSVFSAKPINLPSYKKVSINMDHIMSGHSAGGGRGGPNKDRFPVEMTAPMIEKAIREAYRFAEKIGKIQEVLENGVLQVRQLFQGPWGDRIIQFYFNYTTKIIETAWPK